MTIGRFRGSRHSYRALSRQVDFQESRVGALDSSDGVDKFKKISMYNIEYPWRNLLFCVKKIIFGKISKIFKFFSKDFQFLNLNFFKKSIKGFPLLKKNRTQQNIFLHGYSIFFIEIFFTFIYSIRAIQRTYSRLLKVNRTG